MAFIKDMYRDEIRNGCFVQSDTKKVWDRWLEIWRELDKICRKHEINYWANEETLLGAARHKGFVSWGGGLNFCMMRPDFNRFCEVAKTELSGTTFEIGRKNFFHCRIYDALSTFLTVDSLNEINDPKGLMIEIFPLDVVSDGTEESAFAKQALNELLSAAYNFPALLEHVKNGGFIVNEWSTIENLRAVNNPLGQTEFLNTCAEKFFALSSAVNIIAKATADKKDLSFQKEWFREKIYLPFEEVELPAPVDYDKVLSVCYDDWRTPSRDEITNLNGIYSTDIPYKEFLKKINPEMIFGRNDK